MNNLFITFKPMIYVLGVVGILCTIVSVFEFINRTNRKRLKDKHTEEMRKLRESIYFRDR